MERITMDRLAALERERQERLAAVNKAREERYAALQTRLAKAEQDRQVRLARADRERQERLAASARAREERLAAADRARGERLAKAAQDRKERTQHAYERLGSRGYSRLEAEDLFSFLGARAFEDLFGLGGSGERDAFGNTTSPRRTPRPEAELSPSERTRRHLMTTLPPEKQKTLRTFDESLVRTVIATVNQSREANPDRADWDIHIAYRRAIEVEEPDPLMVQKTQISGILLEGTRKEAHYPF